MSDLMSATEKFDEQIKEAGIADVEVQTHYPPDDFDWPDLPNKQEKLEELPPAPIDALPVVLRNMCREAQDAFKIPIETSMLNALATVGACASKHYKAKIKKGVEARPNIYALTFQTPGERKTTNYTPFVGAVKKWINKRQDWWEDAKIDIEIRAGKIEALKRQIKNGSTDSPEADTAEVKRLQKEPTAPNPDFTASDGTPEALAQTMSECGERLFLASSDAKITLAIILGKYSRDGKVDDGFILKSYDGEPYSSLRRGEGRSVKMDDPCLSIALTTQVRELENIKHKPELIESGFMSRFSFCMPDALAGAVDEDGELVRKFDDAEISEATEAKYHELINMLLDDADKITTTYYVPVGGDARERWIDFYHDIERKMGDEYSDRKDIVIRAPHHALKFALILALCRSDTAPAITLQDMNNAIRLEEYYWLHTQRMLSFVLTNSMPLIAKRIVAFAKKDNDSEVDVRSMQRRMNNVKKEQVQSAIDWLCDNGYCRAIEYINEPAPTGGRPRNARYQMHPDLLN